MSRPRNRLPRDQQFNIRFTAPEMARVHRNAGLTGRDLHDFGRAVLLRRPRPTRKDAPAIISLPPKSLQHWQAAGLTLNTLTHQANSAPVLWLSEQLPITIRQLRSLLRRSFPTLNNDELPAYALHPAVRYHVRKICTNLVQFADRYRALGGIPPVPLSNLIGRFRLILNHDRAHDSQHLA